MTALNDIPTKIALLERGHNELKDAVLSIKESNKEISNAVNRLVILEELHIETRESLKRVFTATENHDKRIGIVEANQAMLLELRSWVLTGLGLIISAVLVAIIALVLK